MINIPLLLGDGLILSILFGLIVGSSLRFNPRIWLQDFPPDIQALVPPKNDQDKRQTVILGFIFLPVFFGGLSTTGARFGTEHGFLWMVVHIYLMFQLVALFDLIVIDWLGMHLIDPQNPPLAGTAGAKGYRDYAFHFRGHLKGSLVGLVISPVIGGIVWLMLSL